MTDYETAVKQAFSKLISDDLDEAIDACEELEKAAPERGEHLFVLALGAMVLGDVPKAMEFLSQGHTRNPDILEFTDSLSVLSARVGKLSDSVYYAKLGVVAQSSPLLDSMMPGEFREVEEQLQNVGVSQYAIEGWVSFHERSYADAAELARKQITLDGGDHDTFVLLGRAHGELKNFAEAIDAIAKAAEKEPSNTSTWVLLGDLLEASGQVDKALDVYRKIVDRNPKSLDAANRLVAALVQSGADHAGEVRDVLGGISKNLQEMAKDAPERAKLPNPLGRVRVAFLVNEQAISKFAGMLETLLTEREEETLRTMVYQLYSQPLPADSRLRRLADDWRAAYNIDDVTFAHIIENDEIHILVDMCGLGAGNRQELLARKVAPVQINWLGLPLVACPETTDLVVDDEIVAADDGIDGVARFAVPGSMISYGGGAVEIELSRENPSPVQKNGHVTFGGLLAPANLRQMVDAWVGVLQAVPDSWLVLGGREALDTETSAKALSLFKGHGVDGRISIQASQNASTARAEFLAAIDIFLDTPYAANVDLICDALWMGVPVIAKLGERAPWRLGASTLIAAGLDDWVASSDDDYIAAAARLGQDQSSIIKHRAELRDVISKSALCDTAAYTRKMERTYRAICEQAA